MLVALREPLVPGDDSRASILSGPGGSAANVAAGLGRLGVETHFVGRAGRDLAGEELVAEMERAGVVPHVARDPEHPTGKVVVLVDPAGERTMITDRSANLRISPKDLPRGLFRPGGHLHLTGYGFFEPGPRLTAREALRLAREAGMSVSVDPSSAALLERLGPERFLEWTRGADLVFPNREEGALLSGTGEPAGIAAVLNGSYPAVVLKLGKEGALYSAREAETVRLPAAPVEAVDTTGAGDALCAGFLAARLAGAPPKEALRRGIEAAGAVVERVGARI